ncbi:hypothetical protein O3P69_009331 [Scylla paramamosain]|uniref:Transposase n=1 Tax=Scylla paramamosain TaxID=85552 RepID=A0AAW0TAT3_SCYPA
MDKFRETGSVQDNTEDRSGRPRSVRKENNFVTCMAEANFHLSGHVNKKNMRFRAMAQPHEYQYRSLNVEKLTVWCALDRNGIIGPYWFEDADARPVTVKTDRYIEVIRRKFTPALRRKRGVDRDIMIYQQDEATPHCSDASLEYLHRYFPEDRLIARHTDHPWPAHSPDLSPLDYFLWGYLKDRVYANNSQIIAVLKVNIRSEIKRIPHNMLDRSTPVSHTTTTAAAAKPSAQAAGEKHAGHLTLTQLLAFLNSRLDHRYDAVFEPGMAVGDRCGQDIGKPLHLDGTRDLPLCWDGRCEHNSGGPR